MICNVPFYIDFDTVNHSLKKSLDLTHKCPKCEGNGFKLYVHPLSPQQCKEVCKVCSGNGFVLGNK
jgi:DnaJ-class molecular chaperone